MNYLNYLFRSINKKIFLIVILLFSIIIFGCDFAIIKTNEIPDLAMYLNDNITSISILSLTNILFLASSTIIVTYLVIIFFWKSKKTKEILIENSLNYSRTGKYLVKLTALIAIILAYCLLTYYVTLNLAIVWSPEVFKIVNQKSFNSIGFSILYFLVILMIILLFNYFANFKMITLLAFLLTVFSLSSIWTLYFSSPAVFLSQENLAINYNNQKYQNINFNFLTNSNFQNPNEDSDFYGEIGSEKEWIVKFNGETPDDFKNFITNQVVKPKDLSAFKTKLLKQQLVIQNIKYTKYFDSNSEVSIASNYIYQNNQDITLSFNKKATNAVNKDFLNSISNNLKSDLAQINDFNNLGLISYSRIEELKSINNFEPLFKLIFLYFKDNYLSDDFEFCNKIFKLLKGSYIQNNNYARFLLIDDFKKLFGDKVISNIPDLLIPALKRKRILNYVLFANQINLSQISNFDYVDQSQNLYVQTNLNVKKYKIIETDGLKKIVIEPNWVTRDVNPLFIAVFYACLFIVLGFINYLIYKKRNLF